MKIVLKTHNAWRQNIDLSHGLFYFPGSATSRAFICHFARLATIILPRISTAFFVVGMTGIPGKLPAVAMLIAAVAVSPESPHSLLQRALGKMANSPPYRNRMTRFAFFEKLKFPPAIQRYWSV